MLAERVEIVIGVDTHKHTHTAAVVTAATGAAVEDLTVSTDPSGYQLLVDLADRHGQPRLWAIEGTGGYGAGLTRTSGPSTRRSSSWTGPNDPLAATAPSPTPSTPSGPPEKHWPGLVSPHQGPKAQGRRCPSASPHDAPPPAPPPTPNAS